MDKKMTSIMETVMIEGVGRRHAYYEALQL